MNKVHYLKDERIYSSADMLLNHILFSKKSNYLFIAFENGEIITFRFTCR